MEEDEIDHEVQISPNRNKKEKPRILIRTHRFFEDPDQYFPTYNKLEVIDRVAYHVKQLA